MISPRFLFFLAVFFSLTGLVAGASEDTDLNLIPEAVQQQTKKKDETIQQNPFGKIYLENVFSVWSLHSGLSVQVPITQPYWQNRTSLDLNQTLKIKENLILHFSDRVDLLEESDFNFPSQGSLRNDFREGYASVEVSSGAFFEAGRINLKNGTALGFNPTDYFKTRSAVSQASADPSVVREFRMGTLMIRGQEIWESGSLDFSYAPKVTVPSAIPVYPPPSLEPLFGQTNALSRWLLTFSHDLADLNPQILIYYEYGHPRFGFNLSHVLTKSIVGYVEWSGGDQSNLSARAIEFGKQTGALPQAAPLLPQGDSDEVFLNDGSAGFSWAGSHKLTVNAEYHYHQAGFADSDLNRWFVLGGTNPSLANELWYIRLYANDQQEPLMQQELFFRADWQDAMVTNLNLSGFAVINAYDGSTFFQIAGSYFLSKNWTVSGLFGAILGGSNTEYGSLPQSTSTALQLTRYF